jgi:hypothetical protein
MVNSNQLGNLPELSRARRGGPPCRTGVGQATSDITVHLFRHHNASCGGVSILLRRTVSLLRSRCPPTRALPTLILDHWRTVTSNVHSIMRRHILIDDIQVIGIAAIIVSLSILAYLLVSMQIQTVMTASVSLAPHRRI